MRVNRHLLAITALFIIALSVRFVPFLVSNLPFNIDGFPLVRISEDIIESGHWDTDYPDGTSGFVTYNVKMPVMSLLISSFALIFGKTPMEVAQFVIPFMSSIAVIIIYAITFKITKNELVSFFAGCALALNGFYVYLGAAVMKETIGLVFLILAVYLYYERDDPRKRILAAALLLLLSLTHHLSAWMAFTMITLLALTQNSIWYSKGSFSTKRFGTDLVSGPFMFVFTYLYYEGIDMNFFNRVSNLNDYALFASVFVMGFVLCILFSMPKARERPKNVVFNKTLLVPIAGSAFIILNAYEPIFEGTYSTPASLLRSLLPYILLLGIALVGLNVIASRKNEHRPFIASLFLAPFLIILFGILKGFDAFTFVLVYRSYDYMDFGVAICAGIGAGYLIKNISGFLTRKKPGSGALFPMKAALSVIFIAMCLATVPLAYNGEEFYGIQDSTYQNEFSAMKWLSANDENHKVSTSERLSDIMAPYFDVDSDQTLPWKLRYDKPVPGDSILFMEDKWTSVGAQMTPMEPFVIKQSIFDRTIQNNDLIYSNAGSHAEVYIVQTR